MQHSVRLLLLRFQFQPAEGFSSTGLGPQQTGGLDALREKQSRLHQQVGSVALPQPAQGVLMQVHAWLLSAEVEP
jgi:hypothetical protein